MGSVMIVLRWILALATAAYALWNAIPAAAAALYKLNKLPSAVQGGVQRYVPMMQGMAWWQIAVWLFADLLYLFAAIRLVSRPRESFGPFVLAVILDLAGWAYLKIQPIYDRTFNAMELTIDYYIIGGLLAAAVLYWLSSRVRKKRVQVAVLSA